MKKDSNINLTVQTKSSGFWGFLSNIWDKTWDKVTNMTSKQFLFVVTLIIVVGFTAVIYNLSKNETTSAKIVNMLAKSGEAEEENLQIRDEITPKVQKEMDKLMYQVDADRVCLFEVHNGKVNSTSLPFRYVDCTQESINSDHMVTYIGDKYQDIPLSHYKIAYSLADCKYLNLTYNAVKRVDARFAQEMEIVNGKHIAAIMVSSSGVNIGFLVCFYDSMAKVPDNSEIKPKLESASKVIGALLDLNVQRRLRFTESQTDE